MAKKAEKPANGKKADTSAGSRKPGKSVGIPTGVPTVLFVLATVVLFGEFIFSRDMLFGQDTLSLGYVARAFFAERLAAGDLPLWSPRLLGGIPSIEALAGGDLLYPTSLLYFIMEPYRALGWKLVLHALAGGFLMAGWVRSLGLNRAAQTLAGLAWVMAPVIITLTLPGNDGKMMVAAVSPAVFWATEALLRRPGWAGAGWLAASVALASLTTQFQTAYFLFLTVGAYAAFRVIVLYRSTGNGEGGEGRQGAIRAGALFLFGALLGGTVAAVQIVPAGSYVQEASRRTATTVNASPEEALAYGSSWSYHPEEVVGLVVPEFVGNSWAEGAWEGTYWGRNAIKGNLEYLGVSVFLLGLVGLAGRGPGPGTRRFFAGAAFVWLLFALGRHTPVWRVFYEVVPGIDLFRVPSLSAFLVSLSFTTLLAFAIHDLTELPPDREWVRSRGGWMALGTVGILVLGLLLQAGGGLSAFWTGAVFPTIDERQRQVLEAAAPFIMRGFFLAVLLAAATTALVWAHQTGRVGTTVLVVGLGLLVAVDLGRVDRAFIQTFDFLTWSAPDANDRFLQGRIEQEEPFRVIDFRDAQEVELAMHGLDLVTGHHPNDLARYRTLLGLQGSQREAANWGHPVVLRILNTRYLLWPVTARGGPPGDLQTLSQAQGRFGVEAVYPYPGLGRAWFVGSYTVRDDEAALRRLLEEPFDPAREVILADEPEMQAGNTAPVSSVTWLEYTPDERVVQLETNGPGFLVISENWHPGWRVWVGGSERTLHRANYTLGAVAIPEAGSHEVRMRYVAPQVRTWGAVSLAALLLTLGLCIMPVLSRGRES